MPTTRPEPSPAPAGAPVDVSAIEADIGRALTHASEPWEYDALGTMRDTLLVHIGLLMPATEEAAGQLHPLSTARLTLTYRVEAARRQTGLPLDLDEETALHQVRQLAITGRLLLAEHKRRQAR